MLNAALTATNTQMLKTCAYFGGARMNMNNIEYVQICSNLARYYESEERIVTVCIYANNHDFIRCTLLACSMVACY